MAKKSEINKKGRLAKSTLSVVLAASMVLTSSSFVWAAPADIAIVEEGETAVEAVEAPVEEAVGANTGERPADVLGVDEVVGVGADAVPVADAVADVTYDGTEQKPSLVIKDSADSNKIISANYYDVIYTDNTEVGTASYEVKFKGIYEGATSLKGNFEIEALELNASNSTVNWKPDTGFFYNGQVQHPEVSSVEVISSGKTVTVPASNYKVVAFDASSDMIKVGAQKVKLEAVGNNITIDASVTVGEKEYIIDKGDFNTNTVSVTAKSVPFETPVGSNFTVKNIVTDSALDPADYTVEYFDKNGASTGITPPTNVGTYKALFKGAGNYNDGTIEVTYQIVDQATLQMKVDGIKIEYNYNTKEQGPTVADVASAVSTATSNELVNETNYTVDVSAAKGTDVGTYQVTLTGINNYVGQTATIPVVIKPYQLPASGVTAVPPTGDAVVYTATLGKVFGGAMSTNAALTLKYYSDGKLVETLVEGEDYTYTTDTKSKKVVITGKGNYTTVNGSDKTVSYKYEENTKGLDFSDSRITATLSGTYSYTGYKITPSIDKITVVDNSGTTANTLRAGTDFVIKEYGDNKNAGEGTVTIEAVKDSSTGDYSGNYTGTKTITFKIAGTDIADIYTIKAIDDVELNAAKDNGKVAVKVVRKDNGATAPSSVYDSAVVYKKDGKDITSDADAFKKAGKIDVEVKGIGQYEGTLTASYNILGESLASATVSAIADQSYTGKAIEPAFTVKLGSTLLAKDKDYTVTYDENIDVGTAYVTITGIGDYSGSVVKSFKIIGTDISKATVTVDGTYTYTGEAIIPTVTVKLGDKVIDAASYEVTATDNINAGTAKATVTGKGGCTGTTEAVEFTIAKADQKLAVSKTITDALKIRNTNANTYTLKVTGAETKLTYKSSNTKIASVNSAGKISFKHVCGKATITVTAAADDNHNAATLKVAVAVKPATPKITITARAKGFNAKATAIKDITGYQVGYSTDKNFAASKTTKKLVATTKALNKNFSGLSAKKGYYVRVRAYKKVGSTVYWGNWTSAKKITTK